VDLDVTLGNCPIDPHTSFEGALDDLRIYDRVLNPVEIQELASTAPDG
jgi:hypothetical protein